MPSNNMWWAIPALFVLLLSTIIHAQGECVFNTEVPNIKSGSAYYTPLSSLRQCLPKIAPDAEMIANTLDAAVATTDGYSYEYMVRGSALSNSPYSISVNMKESIQKMRSKSYAYDYEFHKDLMSLFFSLNDAHTLYTPPNPYKSATLIYPFDISCIFFNNERLFNVKADSPYYVAITGKKSGAVGKRISKINGKSPLEFYNDLGSQLYISKDPDARFNRALQAQMMSFGQLIIPEYDVLSYMFSDGTSINIPLIVILPQSINGPAAFKSLMAPPKLSIQVRDEIPGKFPPTIAIDPLKLIPETQWLEKLHITKDPEEKSMLRGGQLQSLYVSSDNSISYYFHSLLRISVFKISSFHPTSTVGSSVWDEFKHVVEMGVSHAQLNGIKSVVLDVQSNGGGYVCLNNALLAYFIKEYASDLSKLYQPFEYKRNPLIDSARSYFWQVGSILNSTSLQPLQNNQFYDNSVTKRLGGVSASYSQTFYLDCSNQGTFWFKPANHFFNKFIILTDGLCGSSCSQFASKLIFNRKAVSVNVGGHGTSFETTAFNGGSVLQYSDLLKRGTPGVPKLTKSNAGFSFNVFHMYVNREQPIPREFQKISGNIKLNSWEFKNLEALVDQVAPIFNQIEPLNQ